ncbi:hypothetical protein [Nocardioides sp.]|uniref:hypothetical protein n=1 Tax=Nocardioides sp. TaxID=35761 RepID=UPI002C2BCA1F|nr:hypothetical protein [Nocardioides sp.]HXH77317.1 hypothetical protein [Nocardioides sp.]
MTHEEQTDTQTTTLRGSLRERREQARSKLYLDRRVPRIDPPVFVRFKPLSSARLEGLTRQAEKSKDPERYINGSAIAIADACVGIFEVIDDEKVSIDPDGDRDDWPRFDSRLAELLGLADLGKAAPIVRALYLTDGDVTSEAAALTEWSGYAGQEADEEYAGN